MCEVKIHKFKKEHIEIMDVREHEKRLLETFGDLSALEGDFSFTGTYKGVVVSCGGLIYMNDCSASLWQIPSVYVDDVSFVYAKTVKNWIESLASEQGIKRMETVTLTDKLHERWMKFLGFEIEGLKRKAFFDNDYLMWGRLWE